MGRYLYRAKSLTEMTTKDLAAKDGRVPDLLGSTLDHLVVLGSDLVSVTRTADGYELVTKDDIPKDQLEHLGLEEIL